MASTQFDVVGIGNAIVDVLCQAEESDLTALGLAKGAMTLIDSDTADRLYRSMDDVIEVSGGSAANTIAGFASLGGKAAYMGKVKDDPLGNAFAQDIQAGGVTFETPMAVDGDVDTDIIAAAKVTYLEGYLWDPEQAKKAFIKAAEAAHAAGREVSLSLSDPFCVDRHRESFLELVDNHVDILFANEEEIKSLYQVDTFDAAFQKIQGHCKIAAVTRGAKGSVVVAKNEIHICDASPVEKVVDTTGAGDAYAAGFLYGYTQGLELIECARIGGLAAGEVIGHMGGRPETPLGQLIGHRI